MATLSSYLGGSAIKSQQTIQGTMEDVSGTYTRNLTISAVSDVSKCFLTAMIAPSGTFSPASEPYGGSSSGFGHISNNRVEHSGQSYHISLTSTTNARLVTRGTYMNAYSITITEYV